MGCPEMVVADIVAVDIVVVVARFAAVVLHFPEIKFHRDVRE